MKILLSFFIVSGLFAREPDWVDKSYRALYYPSSEYFSYYIENDCLDEEDCRNQMRSQVRKGIIESILVNVASSSIAQTVAINDEIERKFESEITLSSEIEIPNLATEFYFHKRKDRGYAFAYISREAFFNYITKRMESALTEFENGLEQMLIFSSEARLQPMFDQLGDMASPEEEFFRFYRLNVSLGNGEKVKPDFGFYLDYRNQVIALLEKVKVNAPETLTIKPFREWEPFRVSFGLENSNLNGEITFTVLQLDKVLLERTTGLESSATLNRDLLPDLKAGLLHITPVRNEDYKQYARKEINVDFIPAKVYIQAKEKNLGEENLNKMIRSALVEKMTTLSVLEVTNEKVSADLIMEIQAETKRGSENYGMFTSYLNASVILHDTNGEKYYEETIDNLKGVEGSFQKAGIKAYQKALETIIDSFTSFVEEKK